MDLEYFHYLLARYLLVLKLSLFNYLTQIKKKLFWKIKNEAQNFELEWKI